MKSGAELKVGVVVATALVALGLILYHFIGLYAARAGYPLEVVFDRAEVRAGDTVSMAGVPVGRVEWVRLTRDHRALARLRIEDGVAVHRNYHVAVMPGVLWGEKFVEITPVPAAQAGPALEPGARMQGEVSVRLEDLVASSQILLARLAEAVESVTALTGDQQVRQLVTQSLVNMGQAAQDLSGMARTLNVLAAEARPQVSAALADVRRVTGDVETVSRRLAQVAEETEVPQELEEAARLLRATVERVDNIAAQFEALVMEPEMRDFALTAARNLRDASGSIRQASDDLRAAASSVETGARDVPDITATVRESALDLRAAAADIRAMTEQARQTVSRVTGEAAEAAEAIRELPRVKARLNLGAQYLTRDERWWIDVGADLMTQDRLLRIGLADLGETDRFNLQLGQSLGPGWLRYGVVQSQAGVGYDLAVSSRLGLSAELFDPNDLQANVFGYWGPGGALAPWEVVVGYRGLGQPGTPVLGVRTRQ